jgi:predicted GNAT family N-acyltransferase
MVGNPANFDPPVTLTAEHNLDDFQSGEPTLDDWLKQRALANMQNAASRTYVVCQSGSSKVFAYYALSMGQILNRDVVGSMRRNMPPQIPAVILGRLAVDKTAQGNGLGAALLRDAVDRSVKAASQISARLLIVHALSKAAEDFYVHYGFTQLPLDTPTLALDLLKLPKK